MDPKARKRHELSACYPDLKLAELKKLAEGIKRDGQLLPIELYEEEVLDGWQRHRACILASITPIYVDVTKDLQGKDLVEHVRHINEDRRHLTTSQKALAAAKLSKSKWCQDRANAAQQARKGHAGSREPAYLPTQRAAHQAAKAIGVSPASTKRAAKVLKDGAKATVEALEAGDLPITKAANIAKLPKAEQPAAVKEALEKPPTNNKPKSMRAMFQVCSTAFGQLYRTALKMGLDDDKFGPHFEAIIKEINRLGGKTT